MIDIKKVAKLVKEDSLYNTIYFEMKESQNLDGSSKLELEEIETLLNEDPKYVQDFKDINRYSEISSIQALELDITQEDDTSCKQVKQEINENVSKLKALENFSVDSTHSAYEIWIGSAGVMVVFMLHNIVALFSELYNTHGAFVYASFAIILGATYYAYKKIKNNHEKQHGLYNNLYSQTESIIQKAFSNNYITQTELYGRI